MEALGGISGLAGSCVWHVVGLQRSVREWAIRQGWSGRPVRQEQAQGIRVAALGMLEKQNQRRLKQARVNLRGGVTDDPRHGPRHFRSSRLDADQEQTLSLTIGPRSTYCFASSVEDQWI
jgi:hypothetical protein